MAAASQLSLSFSECQTPPHKLQANKSSLFGKNDARFFFSSLKPAYARPSEIVCPKIQLAATFHRGLENRGSFGAAKWDGEKRKVVVFAGAESVPSDAGDVSSNADKEELAKKIKIGTYFIVWWSLNVVFNIYNKKVLNAFPYPWLTSTLSLAAGVTIMAISWALRIVEFPKTDLAFWKSLAPVALAHTIGHVAATVSMSKVAVSFTHIIKSSEPAFSVIVQTLMGEKFALPVYLSLLPIIAGCGLTALTELNFNMTGFMGAMISNLAFVFRNIFSKKGMSTGLKVGGLNYYACLSILSLIYLTPFAFIQEGTHLWVKGYDVAVNTVGSKIIWWIAAQSIFYHLYNQVSYMSLDQISPLTFSIGNTMKRVTVIVSSILIFKTPVSPINASGAVIAILGTFLYSQAQEYQKKLLKSQKAT